MEPDLALIRADQALACARVISAPADHFALHAVAVLDSRGERAGAAHRAIRPVIARLEATTVPAGAYLNAPITWLAADGGAGVAGVSRSGAVAFGLLRTERVASIGRRTASFSDGVARRQGECAEQELPLRRSAPNLVKIHGTGRPRTTIVVVR